MSVENAFITITPYQIFNVLNYIYNDINKTKGKSDLFIYDHFRDSKIIIDNIKKEELFENVYSYSAVEEINIRIISKIRTLMFFLLPQRYFQSVLNNDDFEDLLCKKYRNIYQCSDGLFMNVFHRFFRNTNNYLIEDGLYSYYGNMKADRTGSDYKFVNKYLLGGTLNLNANKLYVNSPSLCESTSAKEVSGLPKLINQDNLFDMYKRIFSFENTTWYKDKKFIFLTTPYENLRNVVWKGEVSNNDQDLIRILNESGKEYAVRLHPRQKNFEYYSSAKFVDNFNNMWELECRESISDNQVLISFFSTAVFTPKILYDKEPYVIFTFKILTDSISGDSIVEKLRLMYRNPNKIFVPNNILEFNGVVTELSKR